MANERPEYRTLHAIPDPVNIGRNAYNEGEPIFAQVVDDWGLVVGEDVESARPNALPAPAGNASRGAWATYRLSQGVPAETVDAMTRDELRDFGEQTEPAPAVELGAQPAKGE